MAIRKMTAADLEAAVCLEQACFSDPWSRAVLEESLTHPLYHYFAEEEDGTVRGYAGLSIILDEGNIANIAVLPEYQRRGIGEALLQALIRCAREAGVRDLFLEVREHNAPAIALYEKYGFQRTGYRKDYYQDPVEDARIYTLKLSGEE